MNNPKFINITIFVLFFGLALIEAIQKNNWHVASIFLILAVLSFWVDIRKN